MTRSFALIFTCIILTLNLIAPAHGGGDYASAPNEEQCFEGVCLGESIRKLTDIPWLELEAVPQFQDPIKSFPVFRRISLIDTMMPHLGGMTAAATAAVKRISGLRDPDEFLKLVRLRSDASVDLGRTAVLMLQESSIAFCKSVEFFAYFRSKSGHATTVSFTVAEMSPRQHGLVVQYIGRRFVMQAEAGGEFKTILQRDYPSLVGNEDLQAQCGMWGCLQVPGQSASPSRETAAEAALVRGRDYIVYFTPPWGGYADLELQLIPPNFFELYEKERLPQVQSRLPVTHLSEHPSCAKPKPIVPPVE